MNAKRNDTIRLDINDYHKDFVNLFRVVYQRKWLITLGTTIFTILAFIISFIIPKVYKCEAFYQLSGTQVPLFEKSTNQEGEIIFEIDKEREAIQEIRETENIISVPEYKRYSSLFTNGERFLNFIGEKQILKDEEFKDVKNRILASYNLSKYIKPYYSYSKEDRDQLASIPEEEKNYVLGVSLSYENNHPTLSKKTVYAIGDFIRNCIIYGKLRDYINSRYSYSVTKEKKIENLIIKANFDLEQLGRKRQDIQSIYSKYPEFSKIENRQVISVEQKGYRFLSPLAQLVGIESKISDIKEALANYEREKEKAEINYEFFSKMKETFNKDESGEAIFQELVSIKNEIFKDENSNVGIKKEVYNQLNIDLENFNTLFFEEMHFTSDPSIPPNKIQPKKSVIIIAGFFISFFLFVLLSLLIEFWNKNRESITSKK